MSKAVQEDSPVPQRRADTDAVSPAVLEQLSSRGYQGRRSRRCQAIRCGQDDDLPALAVRRRWCSTWSFIVAALGITDSSPLSGDLMTRLLDEWIGLIMEDGQARSPVCWPIWPVT